MRAEVDGVLLAHNPIPLEGLERGEFRVGETGDVQVELLYDGGDYRGELAVFSLTGMESLLPGTVAYIEEAARRALSRSHLGHVLLGEASVQRFQGDIGQGLQPSLPSPTNQEPLSVVQSWGLSPGDRVAFFLVPDGTVASVLANPDVGGKGRPLFSIAAANPSGLPQFAQLAEGVVAIEDLRRDRSSDNDFEDVIFALSGIEGSLGAIDDWIDPDKNWLNRPAAQQLRQSGLSPLAPSDLPPAESPEPLDSPLSEPELELDLEPAPEPEPLPEPEPTPPLPEPEPLPPLPDEVVKSIESNRVVKFYRGDSEVELIARGAPRIRLGSQTLYIGTQQVSAINQNPIISSFDRSNPANNWTRTDYEVTGSDGRGMGLFWSGTGLYGVFTVDGAQGTPDQDFRWAAAGAEQAWLRSYGQGGGSKIAILARLDPATGDVLSAAHLSAVLSSGNSNSFTVDDILLDSSGNLIVRATIAFAPRNPDGSRMQQSTPGSSPFAYTLEITPDLRRVLNTSAPGWISAAD